MTRIQITALLLVPMLWALTAADVAVAGKPIPVRDSWIVELASEPTLTFRGDDNLRIQSAGGSRAKGMAPTAPELTGSSRLDVNAPAVRDYVALLDQERNSVLAEAARSLGRDIRPKAVYRHTLNGFAVNMSDDEAAVMARLPGVVSVTQDMAYLPELDEGPKLIGASALWSAGIDGTRGEGVVIGVIDSGINWDHVYFTDDPAQSDGHTYTNPLGSQLGECSKASVPCNDKLIGVWNFADEGTNGKDPDESGHGTHVSSIAAGNPFRFNLTDIEDHQFNTSGAAPRANIVSYKVCFEDHPDDEELDGRCVSSAIGEALEQVVEDGVDIVNYSIGGNGGNPWSQAQPFLNVRSAGILLVSSAGNSGPNQGTITSPANAPWVMGIASTTHQRRVGNRARVANVFNILVEPGTGPDIGSDISGPVIAADEVSDSLLACEPFTAGAFSGAIAFVQRGECTFETKVNNAENAGAVAVLVFNNVGGLPVIMAGLEDTGIPSAMMDLEQGELALTSIRGTSDPVATLFAEQTAILNRDWEDRVSGFSARGPGASSPGVMKPNAAAPGQSILGGFVPDENSLGFLSGTSMASPHVAGAAALLKARHPGWSPDIIQSALETTAETGPVTVDAEPATILDRGAGRIRVDRAADIGLYLPITTSDFENADPAGGGNPANLNLPGVFSENCAATCEFTRTVRALQPGIWSVDVEGSLAVTVSPDSFELSQGESQELSISVDVRERPLGTTFDGSIVLAPGSQDLSVQRLPVGVISSIGVLPDSLDISASANRGSTTMSLDDIAPIPEADFRTSRLTRPERETFDLLQDNDPDDPYSGGSGTRTFLIDVPEDALLLLAETVASSANDIDLFVGFDANGNEEAEESEELCNSRSPNEFEECIIESPTTGTWWILVQNWDASSPSAADSVDLDIALLTANDDPSLVASGPGRHDGGTLTLSVFWDQPAMRRGESWIGAIAFSSSPDEIGDGGVVPVNITRTADEPVRPTALFDGETLPVILAGGTVHDRLFFDVPPGADQVAVEVVGDSGVSVELRRVDFEAIADSAPGTPPASGTLLGSGTASGSGINIAVDGEAGRWYVLLENTTGTEKRVDVEVDITESAPNNSRRGLWSPRDRQIFQGIEWQESGGTEFIVWYSYEADGLPMFYNAIAAPRENSSIWTADLLRTTSIGTRNNVDTVGRISVTQIGEEEMIVAWRLNGAHGSERFSPDAPQTCPSVGGQPTSYTGHWFSPGASQGGTTMIVTHLGQAQVRYYFDQSGTGRWVITTSREGEGPLAEALDVLELRGFCPTCEETEVTIETVGSYARMFGSESSGSEIVDITTGPPLSQDFVTEVPISKLSSRMECR